MFSHSFYLQLYDHLLHHKNIYCNHRKLGSNILYCVSFNTFCDMVPFLRVVWRIHEIVLTKCAPFFSLVFFHLYQLENWNRFVDNFLWFLKWLLFLLFAHALRLRFPYMQSASAIINYFFLSDTLLFAPQTCKRILHRNGMRLAWVIVK